MINKIRYIGSWDRELVGEILIEFSINFQGCHRNDQKQLCKTPETCPLTVLEASGLKSGCRQGHAVTAGPGEGLLPGLL